MMPAYDLSKRAARSQSALELAPNAYRINLSGVPLGESVITIGQLPPSIRTAYGFRWGSREARAFLRWTSAIRRLRHALPPLAREQRAARGDKPHAGGPDARHTPNLSLEKRLAAEISALAAKFATQAAIPSNHEAKPRVARQSPS